MDRVGKGKRMRSPATGEGVTPPQKRTLNSTPPNIPAAATYRDMVQASLVHVIVGAEGVTINGSQVVLVMEAVVRELEGFIGSTTKAPSFNGKQLGESELELECADDRTVAWLKWIVPKLKPWKNASLSVITKSEWQSTNRPGRMFRMSVLVPWRTYNYA